MGALVKRNPASAGPVAIVARVLGLQLFASVVRWSVRAIVRRKNARPPAASESPHA